MVAELEAELAAEQQRSAGHRADYERERERADRMVATQDRLVGDEPAYTHGRRAAVCPGGHPPDMERDDLAAANTLAAHNGVTRHVMVGFYGPAVRFLRVERDETAQQFATARPEPADKPMT